ncbi:MAG: nicotinate phosphoribosyltransferase [Deltaproteobacteria bacterium]|nr:nicotinate phosphoribosyltransferase [Deltaproteobacteria bacterium]
MEALKTTLPEDYRPYIDVYFHRTLEILKAEGLNPWVRGQVMIRKGPGTVGGIDEAIAAIEKYDSSAQSTGRIWALEEGESYDARETLLIAEKPIQSFVDLETLYLGVLSRGTTSASDGVDTIDFRRAKEKMAAVVSAAEGRPVFYFGARHWDFREDAAIAQAAFDGGATGASTDIAAALIGKKGLGTIPHVLENIMAWRYGKDQAVVEATKAFDRHIDSKIPRIALIDYNNREIDDSLATARALEGRLYGVRVDTCGENVAQGACLSPMSAQSLLWKQEGLRLPELDAPEAKYWYGSGVTVTGVFALRRALDAAGFQDVKIVLSSGFADVQKVRAFVAAEKILGVRLFDSLGVGGIYDSRAAKMDIVAVGDAPDQMTPISKAGRSYSPNPRLKEVAALVQ